jgi:hypothetical protein
MYQKQADRLIVRDVCERLTAMDDPDWTQAVHASWDVHPHWFRHHAGQGLDRLGEMLVSAGVELVVARQRMDFVGNEQPDQEG